ncbi:NAD-dependent succinate-semialdehyde dehydrogenase [Tenggerimyces flavus]|uniref:NAD-dependent succinate-semialdehyde dehydrogenase n=1 Tax=Tenggerimyces flavus TaxID=1708749 RepID=A0ABV7Y9L5_9ACTN|nr:NAD-dependent succinate-semialdehyde dehydrogenase [Tenggerimyces flavus]MBM7785128.1 succinate-semialdehyde dehydrogenase/glutarate-semialdehyde dehydrogenase [Tenggerimyces flavus]
MTPGEREGAVVGAVPKGLFIGGEWRDAEGGRELKVEDPATGEVLCAVADASPKDGQLALDAAAGRQAEWGQTPPRARSEILYNAFELLKQRQEDLALLMTLEMGKPLAEARGEILYAAEFLRWFAEEAVRIQGSYLPSPDGKSRFLVMKQPVGTTLLITPWNFPMAMGTRKIGPAIAAGCTMVAKPAPQTPLSMLALAAILDEAGLPKGVLNVIPTSDAGPVMEPLIKDRRTRKLSFTGSTAVGKILLTQSSEQVLKVSLELGGNAPFIVFDDADLDRAVEGAMLAKMRNVGEACTAANRFFVHADVADAFATRLAERMGALKIGRGTEDGVEIGPLVDAAAVAKVSTLVDDARQRGARTVLDGGPIDGKGHFYQPTVLADVPPDARMGTEEIFGPVAPITTFTDEDDVVARANSTDFGLISYVFSQDIDRALRVAERMESGLVGLNSGLISNPAAPFGGVKQSGLGREGGLIGIDEFVETKYVGIPVR